MKSINKIYEISVQLQLAYNSFFGTDKMNTRVNMQENGEYRLDADAMFNRAVMYENCEGGPVYSEAIKLYDRAIALGHARAMFKRAFMYVEGKGGPVNYPEAIKLYDKAIALGYINAMINRAIMHDMGQGGPVNYLEEIKLYDMAIALGDADAMNNRASMYTSGQGGPVNYPEAIKLYDMAISLGDADAMSHRAFMYLNGQGGPVNYPEAIKLYDKAIALNHARAMFKRAFMYVEGKGGPVNYPEVIKLYDKAIALGHADAMYHRAFMYLNGQGEPVNYPEAIKLYDKAIALNHAGAMNNRAFMYLNGQGGPVNYPEAIKLYDKAIALNHAGAMVNRAIMYETGQGGPNDYINAARLYRQAIINGINDPEIKIRNLLDKTTDMLAKYHIYMANKKSGSLPAEIISMFKSNPEEMTFILLADTLLTPAEKQEAIDFIGASYIDMAVKLEENDNADSLARKKLSLLEKVPENSCFYNQALFEQTMILYSLVSENNVDPWDVPDILKSIDMLHQRILENDKATLENKCDTIQAEIIDRKEINANNTAIYDFKKHVELIDQFDRVLISSDDLSSTKEILKFDRQLSGEEQRLHCIVDRTDRMNVYAAKLKNYLMSVGEKLDGLSANNMVTDRLGWGKLPFHLEMARKELKFLSKKNSMIEIVTLASIVGKHLQQEKSGIINKDDLNAIPAYKSALEIGKSNDMDLAPKRRKLN